MGLLLEWAKSAGSVGLGFVASGRPQVGVPKGGGHLLCTRSIIGHCLVSPPETGPMAGGRVSLVSGLHAALSPACARGSVPVCAPAASKRHMSIAQCLQHSSHVDHRASTGTWSGEKVSHMAHTDPPPIPTRFVGQWHTLRARAGPTGCISLCSALQACLGALPPGGRPDEAGQLGEPPRLTRAEVGLHAYRNGVAASLAASQVHLAGLSPLRGCMLKYTSDMAGTHFL